MDGRSEAERLAESWIEWLGQMKWTHFATGTFQQEIQASASLRAVRSWLAGFPDSCVAVGIQRGPTSGTNHLHMLVGGVSPLGTTLLRQRWVRRGHLQIERFDPRQEGIRYLVKQADFIELIGTPQWFRPRRRRQASAS